jgi:hypothetical protein
MNLNKQYNIKKKRKFIFENFLFLIMGTLLILSGVDTIIDAFNNHLKEFFHTKYGKISATWVLYLFTPVGIISGIGMFVMAWQARWVVNSTFSIYDNKICYNDNIIVDIKKINLLRLNHLKKGNLFIRYGAANQSITIKEDMFENKDDLIEIYEYLKNNLQIPFEDMEKKFVRAKIYLMILMSILFLGILGQIIYANT